MQAPPRRITTLYAALHLLSGSVIGECMQRHRHQEFVRFMSRICVDGPAGQLILVVRDNYRTHDHPKVRAWLDRHERCTFRHTLTSACLPGSRAPVPVSPDRSRYD